MKGRPMIQWVIAAARKFTMVEEVIVATDHEEIAAVAREGGAQAVMTPADLPSGTDRIHRAVQDHEADYIINLQGDEPLMPREAVESAHASVLLSGADVATACVPIHTREDFEAPHIVKVVRDGNERALYFSRSPIPSLARRGEDEMRQSGCIFGFKHLGLYIYTRNALERFCELSPSSLEKTEKLEQLRMLENGMSIICVTSSRDSIGVDVEEDIARVEALLPDTPEML